MNTDQQIQIQPYASKYREAFYKLNEAWITQYFKMEQPDYDALENPESYILDQGGAIFVATLNHQAVGVCALIRRQDLDCYELAKMAVDPQKQGYGIGFKLGLAIIEKAKSLGAKKLYLESNTSLVPAIELYKKLGFQKIEGASTPYERCNIQMELWFR